MMAAPASSLVMLFGTMLVALLAQRLDIVQAAPIGLIVSTAYGSVQGVREAEGVISFYQIPFASPPVDDLRLKPAVPPTAWPGVRDCTQQNNSMNCVNFAEDLEVHGQEDCLYLNVYVPDVNTTDPLPVMVWIYGGGFVMGSDFGRGDYDGRKLAAERQVIVVEGNYRLGPLGFLALPELFSESGNTGNYGTLDQVMVLRFVNQNIENFGGSTKDVTIFGESAGAFSVCWHVTNPNSAGLFKAAIMESGSCTSHEFYVSLPRAYEFGGEFLNKTGCEASSDVLACLRSLSAGNFTMRWNSSAPVPPFAPLMPWGPVIDGVVLVERPIDAIRGGRFNRVPMIMGTNLNEGTIFAPMAYGILPDLPVPLDNASMIRIFEHFFNETASQQILNMYPVSEYNNDYMDALANIMTDWVFLCSTRAAGRAIAAWGIPVYIYQFTHKVPQNPEYDLLGDYHSIEISFVFDGSLKYKFDAYDQLVSDDMTLYWTNLAKYGDPNFKREDKMAWPLFSTANDQVIRFQVPLAIVNGLSEDLCNFWDNIYPVYN